MTADCVGGVFGFAFDLARELLAHGAAVSLAVLGAPLRPEQREALAGLAGLALHERVCALEWMDEPWGDVDASGAWLLELSERWRPEVVHLNGYSHAALGFGVPKLVVAHSCVRGWWRAVYGEPAPPRFAEYTRRVRAGLERADCVVAPTRAMLATLAQEYGFDQGHVIPNGIRQAPFVAAAKERCFAAAGRFWDLAKNLRLLQQAAPRLPWPVLVAGARPGDTEVAGLELLGELPRSKLARVLARAGAFLHPARYEPFGLAPLEAALSGSALVLGDIASLREVWGHAALYVPVDEPEALVRAARRLAHDATLRAALASRARARAVRYSAAAMATGYLRAYQQVARGRLLTRPAPSEPVTARLEHGARAHGKERSF